jgi:hypothetical protein
LLGFVEANENATIILEKKTTVIVVIEADAGMSIIIANRRVYE